jgi:hypothetical protein
LRLLTEALEHRLAPSTNTFLSMPATGFAGQEGGTVAAFPVSINQLQDSASHVGLSAATIAMTFPTGVFSFPIGSQAATSLVHLGTVPLTTGTLNWTLTANSPADGTLNVSLLAKTGGIINTNNPPNGGTLFTIDFPVSDVYNPTVPTDEAITIVSANGIVHTQVQSKDSGSGGVYRLSPTPPYAGTITINPAAQKPPTVITPQNFVIGANTSLSEPAPGLLTGASDPQHQPMVVDAIDGSKQGVGGHMTLPSGAVVAVQSDGSFSYVPAPDFVGSDSFTFTIMDQGGNVSDPGTVNIQVTPTVSLQPEGITSGPAGTVISEDVILDNPNPGGSVGALNAFNLAFIYDSSAVSPTNVSRGADIPINWVLSSNTDTAGVITIGAYTTSSPLTGPAPLLLATIDFTVISNANQSTAIKLVPSVKIGATSPTTQVVGTASDFAINPAPSSARFVNGVDTSITVTGGTAGVSLSPSGLPDGDVGLSYVAPAIDAIGGDGGPFTYDVTGGGVPPGLVFSTVNDPQYLLSGTPTFAGTYTFTVTATDISGNSASQDYTVLINPPVTITTTALADWTISRTGYNLTVGVTGGTGAYTIEQTDGVLPPGLALNSDGVVSGTPTTAGSYTFTVTATDTLAGTASQTYTVVVNPQVTFTTPSLAGWTVNADGYSQVIGTSGGTGSITFTETGALPAGLTLSSSGELSGTPTAAGSYAITVTATDTLGSTASQAYTITINPGVALTTPALSDWTVGKTGYNQTVNTTGGTGSFTFSVPAGSLPPGLVMSSAGVFSGTPAVTGTYTFPVTATDSVGASVSQTYTIAINTGVDIPNFQPVTWTLNLAGYNQTIIAEGGTGAKTFAVDSGSLPAGLTLSSAGVISGTPTASGLCLFLVTATDTVGAACSPQSFTILINPQLAITAATLPNWTVFFGYSQSITTSGGTGTATFTLTSGTLPAGTTLSSAGVVSGTPTTTGTFTFAIKATDTLGARVTQAYTVTINPVINVTTATLPNWTVNQAGYDQTITATGGTGAVTFSISSGALPDGMGLGNGVISGTPTTANQISSFTILAMDTVGARNYYSYTIEINPVVTFTTTALSNWTVNQPGYSQAISTTGGTGADTFAVTTGTLPTGISMTSGGVFSGTPTATGTFTFTVTATDSVAATGTKSYTVVINPTMAITTTALPNWTAAFAYNKTIATTGGTSPITFVKTSGTLPVGVSLGSSGVLSGTPTTAGSYTFAVQSTDKAGVSSTESYTVVVQPAVAIATTALPNWTSGVAFSQTIAASGGTGTLTLSKTAGTLPAGLTLSSGGVIAGTPTTAGTYTFTVTATDTLGATKSQAYTVTISPTVAITTTALPAWTADFAGYHQTITATGGTSPVTFSSAGTLPTGLTLSSAGVLSGTPTTAGTYSFTVTATDNVGVAASASYTVTISPAVTIATSSLSNATVNEAGYNQAITVNGGTGTKTFAVTAGTLPQGLTLSSAGVLSGTATALGISTFTVTATDTIGASVSQAYTVGVYEPAVSLAVSASPIAVAGTPFSLTVEAKDSAGNLAGGYDGTITLSSSAGVDISPTSVLVTNGIATVPVTLTKAVDQTITAEVSGLTSGSTSVTVSPGAVGQFLVAVAGRSTTPAGKAVLVTVQAADAYDNLITNGYSGPTTVTASISPATTASSFPTTVPISSNGLGFFLGSIDKVGSYTITASSGALTGSTTTPMTVTPGVATKLGFVAQPTSTATGVKLGTITVAIQDQFGNTVTTGSESTRPVTVMVASGPGAFLAGSSTTVDAVGGVATFANLTLSAPGAYTLSELVPSLYTGPNSTSFSVAPLQVVPGSFVSTPSGFSLQFNAPYLVNSVTPVLYGSGFGAGAPAPSVTLTGPSGLVEGSLVLDPATNRITFVATNTAYEANTHSPLPPDGSYTAVIRSSGAAAFQALNSGGGSLDGLGSGVAGSGDFTATFTVDAGAKDVVWVPATADGPGQPLVAPGNNQSGGGYPVYLSDTTGAVTHVQVTLNYNPALLTVTGVTGAGFTLSASSTPGQAVLEYNGPPGAPGLPTGSQVPIGFVTAMVPSGSAADPTPYRAKDLLRLSNIAINEGSIAAVGGDALHLVAYVGDGDGNGNYSSADAVLVTRAALQSDSGFAGYPLVDPVIVADTDGSGFIPADAALQVNEGGVGYPTANLPSPPIPDGVVFQPIANNVDPTLTLGVRGQGPGVNNAGVVTATVGIDDAHPVGSTGLVEAHLALTYDPRQFTVSAADVHVGTVLAGGVWIVIPTIDQATGQLGIALSGSTPVTSTLAGSLVTIDFHQVGRMANPSSIALVASVNPGGQLFTTELEDAQGTFILTPAPTNSSAARFDSTVVLPATATGAGATEITPAPVLVEIRSGDSAGVDRPVSTASVWAVASESAETEVAPQAVTEASAGRDSLHAVVAAASSAVISMVSSATGLLMPFGGAVLVNAQASTGQHLADQLFQALGREAASPSIPLPGALARDAVECSLAGQVLQSPTSVDRLNGINWEEAGSDLDWQPASAAVAGPESQTARPGTPPATEAEADAYQATVDVYFAEEE